MEKTSGRRHASDEGRLTTRHDAPHQHEPGWAGASREAGWGRGGGVAGRGPKRRKKLNDHAVELQSGLAHDATRSGRDAVVDGEHRSHKLEMAQRDRNGTRKGCRCAVASAGVSRRVGQDDDLHGSWVARRTQKAKEALALSAFRGKRTQFEDDD